MGQSVPSGANSSGAAGQDDGPQVPLQAPGPWQVSGPRPPGQTAHCGGASRAGAETSVCRQAQLGRLFYVKASGGELHTDESLLPFIKGEARQVASGIDGSRRERRQQNKNGS